ncbi:MAG: YihY/virulence factor BrkB family protein [Candidatus Omnitrophica bacterium]|nr:YihY/virulence factor BrkB family protein [Candidatus Omnitrophota bacterium]
MTEVKQEPSQLKKPSSDLTPTRLSRAAVRFVNSLRIVWKLVNEKSVWAHASVCGYTTILSLVPILAISLTIISAFTSSEKVPISGMDGQQEEIFSNRVFDFFFDHFVPGISDSTHEEVQVAKREILFFVEKAKSLRFVILVMLIIASVSLFNSIEHAFNEIWAVRHRRTFFAQFLAFWILLTITPLLLALSYYYTTEFASSEAVSRFMRIEWGSWIFWHGISYIFTLFAFLVANRYLPNLHVRLIPALIGSALSAILWESAKVLFDYYMNYVLSTEGYYSIFGTLAAIPLFICWLYYSYLCFLIGPVIATTVQDYPRHLARLKRRTSLTMHRPIQSLYVFLDICRHFRDFQEGISLPQLEEIEGITPNRLRRCLYDLQSVNLIHKDSSKGFYYPSADPHHTELKEILERLMGVSSHSKQPLDEAVAQTARSMIRDGHIVVSDLLDAPSSLNQLKDAPPLTKNAALQPE